MKTKTIITEITHDDLVNLLSTAMYGSSWLSCDYRVGDNMTTVVFNENDCWEDKIARCLLAGKTVDLEDYYAEDEGDHYGALPHHYDKQRGCMAYTITLKDIEKACVKMLDTEGWYAKYVHMWANEDCGFDQCVAEAIMQVVMFGEEIYG